MAVKTGKRIGRLPSRRKRKNHPKFKSSRTKQLPAQKLRVPPTTGFVELLAKTTYDGRDNTLRVVVTGKKAPGNLGPGLRRVEVSEDWHRHMISSGEARRFVERLLVEVEKSDMPELGMHIERCLPQGADELRFMERTCSRCTCPYCELSVR